uniref:Uncharacterized protein n=1 Tax=Arundo donax TaxID=35708 RepID=A0A0A8XTF7_ARUDO
MLPLHKPGTKQSKGRPTRSAPPWLPPLVPLNRHANAAAILSCHTPRDEQVRLSASSVPTSQPLMESPRRGGRFCEQSLGLAPSYLAAADPVGKEAPIYRRAGVCYSLFIFCGIYFANFGGVKGAAFI